MQTVISFSNVISDDWVLFDRSSPLSSSRNVLVSVDDLARYPRYFEHSWLRLGIELDPDDELAGLASWLPRMQLVRLNFASFADGRPFSQAKLLRERFSYTGDIRAHGQVLRDQLAFMRCCGINQFSLAEGEDVELALAAFNDISNSYQPDSVKQELARVVNA